MLGIRRFFALAALGISVAAAQDVVYVMDLTIFTALAPCAASAVEYNVQSQTYDNCPEAVEDLQSCVCTKNNNRAAVSRAISSSVSYSCGATATEDQASAATVFDAYCGQGGDEEFAFPEPDTSVTEFITDVPGFGDLAPCAASGLSYIVQSMTYDLCPADAANLASCVCNKNQNSLRASQGINTSVRYSCASNTADISSAQAVFAGYCGLSNGTSSFPEASGPPGDMTYYITALSQYSDLAPCAQSAISYEFFAQTNDLCPGGPQALASCVCLKNGMSRFVTNQITSDVKYSCGKTASEDISSAMEVFDYYCSAAQALVTPEGVIESASETAQAGGGVTSGPSPTTTPDSGFGDLGLGDSGSGNDASSDDSESSPGDSSDGLPGGASSPQSARRSNTGVIVGAVVGVVGGLLIIGLSAFFFWRRSRQIKAREAAAAAAAAAAVGRSGSQGLGPGKPELDGAASPPSPSPSPSAIKAQPSLRAENVSPVSVNTNHPPASELHAQAPGPQMAELPPHALAAAGVGSTRPELQGQNSYSAQMTQGATTAASQSVYSSRPQEAAGQQVHEAPVRHPTQVHEMHGQSSTNWQSGPVPQFHEVDGSPGPARTS